MHACTGLIHSLRQNSGEAEKLGKGHFSNNKKKKKHAKCHCKPSAKCPDAIQLGIYILKKGKHPYFSETMEKTPKSTISG